MPGPMENDVDPIRDTIGYAARQGEIIERAVAWMDTDEGRDFAACHDAEPTEAELDRWRHESERIDFQRELSSGCM